jgi:hypothetical protein
MISPGAAIDAINEECGSVAASRLFFKCVSTRLEND